MQDVLRHGQAGRRTAHAMVQYVRRGREAHAAGASDADGAMLLLYIAIHFIGDKRALCRIVGVREDVLDVKL